MTCFNREDTLECPVDQKAQWEQSLVGTLYCIFTVCDFWFQTLVGTCSFLRGHLMLRSHRANPSSSWLRLTQMSCPAWAPGAGSSLKF